MLVYGCDHWRKLTQIGIARLPQVIRLRTFPQKKILELVHKPSGALTVKQPDTSPLLPAIKVLRLYDPTAEHFCLLSSFLWQRHTVGRKHVVTLSPQTLEPFMVSLATGLRAKMGHNGWGENGSVGHLVQSHVFPTPKSHFLGS